MVGVCSDCQYVFQSRAGCLLLDLEKGMLLEFIGGLQILIVKIQEMNLLYLVATLSVGTEKKHFLRQLELMLCLVKIDIEYGIKLGNHI